MTCQPLPRTGVEGDLGLLVVLALALVSVGIVLRVARRSRRGGGVARAGGGLAALALLVVGVTVAVVAPAPSARAATWDCLATDGSLTVRQVSVLDGLAPGVEPVAIEGLLTNTGGEGTVVAAVDVTIASVALAGHRVGSCGASDYLLLDPRMPVGRTLAPGDSASFTGAAIGFRTTATDQDACQGATVHLRYTVVPGTTAG
ncbi:hypothetical protein [Cellulomonas sp. S1-8]|uniref:hypothetical protein n=1 Tax=Cellulomonas sp. S1-8 TaxID=2904790 RepID=UPI0022446DF0|nr:hypothetical protein [Cellulomonas sp. S1-8]UZN01807.1 hypothetical protein OKX07_11950 [Cellulomonas sp. S1-8]